MKVNILIDNHLSAGLNEYRPDGFSERELSEFIDEVRPSRLTVFAFGHDGYAQYPSRIGRVAPGLELDLPMVWRNITRSRGVAFALYVSTLRNDILQCDNPNWTWPQASGENGFLDHNSPYLENWLLPVLGELIDRYDPDGFFLDGDYWTVRDSTGSFTKAAAWRKWPNQEFKDLSIEQHRLLTLETYEKYIGKLGNFLAATRRQLSASVNVAFTFRHPVRPPPGINLVTSDLPPFFGALDCWMETSLVLDRGLEREVVVPLFAEPEGCGRKYKKGISQLIQEIAPLVSLNAAVHFYLPMKASGHLESSYARTVTGIREQIEGLQRGIEDQEMMFDPDVLCIVDADAVGVSQDFSRVRGAQLAASIAGLNSGVATADRCRERLERTRLLILVDGIQISEAVKELIAAGQERGIAVLGNTDSQFGQRLERSNWRVDEELIRELRVAYHSSRQTTIWSSFIVQRPWCVFIRGLIGIDGSLRLFFWNAIERGSRLGRHVLNSGAGQAGTITVECTAAVVPSKIWGQIGEFAHNERSISFVLDGAFASLECGRQ
jgi:hypothetical protein